MKGVQGFLPFEDDEPPGSPAEEPQEPALGKAALPAPEEPAALRASCPLEALDQAEDFSPSAAAKEQMSGTPPPEQDEARRALFHEAVRRLDLLRAAAKKLGFEEPELEAAFERHAGADTFTVAFPVERPDEDPEVTAQREVEREFVQVAAERWQARTEEFPRLSDLADEAARLQERGGDLTPLRVRKVLGVKNAYEEKLDRRRTRLERAAERAEERSAAAFEQSKKAIEHVPFGQPILVGHHSERAHRNALKKSHRAMDRSVDELRLAEELERKAKAVGKAGISADDPDAPEKLHERLAELERRRAEMKRVNAEFRSGGWDAVSGLSDDARDTLKAAMARAPWVRAPFESYALSNLAANIRRVKQRIEELEVREVEAPRAALQGPGYRLEEAAAENRLRFLFDSKPEEPVRRLLKQQGFRWSPHAGAWQRQLNSAGRAAAERVRTALHDLEGESSS